jgi:hypothetical protein
MIRWLEVQRFRGSEVQRFGCSYVEFRRRSQESGGVDVSLDVLYVHGQRVRGSDASLRLFV